MEFRIYLNLDEYQRQYKKMKPKDTLEYKFVLSDLIKEDRPDTFDRAEMEKLAIEIEMRKEELSILDEKLRRADET